VRIMFSAMGLCDDMPQHVKDAISRLEATVERARVRRAAQAAAK
jgi:hypothetical protein